MGITKKQSIIIAIEFILILLFLFVIGSGDVISPIYGDVNVIDEGEYGGWLMHLFAGQHLYTDVYAAYGPFYIYPVYLLAKLFSPTVFLIRIVYMVFNVFFAVVIVQLILREIKIAYYLQLFCILLLLIIPGFGMRQGMGFLSLFLLYKAVSKKNYWWSILAGLSLACTFLTSSDIGLFSGVISVFYLALNAVCTKEIKVFLKKILLIVFSYLFIFVLFYLWSVSEGWFTAYVNTIIGDLILYSSASVPIGRSFPNALLLMPHSFSVIIWLKYILSKQILLYWLYFFYIITFIYFSIRIILRKYQSDENLFVLISLFGFLLSAILIGRTDHLIFTLAPVFISFSYYLKKLFLYLNTHQDKKEKVVTLILILFIFVFSIRLISIYRPHFLNIFKIPKAVATNKNSIPYLGPIAISQKQAHSFELIQNFVTTHTNKNDTIFFFSNDPILYLLTGKNDPTKYDLPEVANTKDKREELLQVLKAKKPKFIIFDNNSYAVDGVSNYERLPEVATYIKQHYTESIIGSFVIYKQIAKK